MFVNGHYIDKLDVSLHQVPGSLGVGTGFYDGAEIEGKITKFTEFSVWSLDDQTSAEDWLNIGQNLYDYGLYEDALKACQKAEKLAPNNSRIWYCQGGILLTLKRYEESITAYDKALLYQPNLQGVWYWRGQALEKLERYQEATTSYTKALELKPDYKEAQNALKRISEKSQRSQP